MQLKFCPLVAATFTVWLKMVPRPPFQLPEARFRAILTADGYSFQSLTPSSLLAVLFRPTHPKPARFPGAA